MTFAQLSFFFKAGMAGMIDYGYYPVRGNNRLEWARIRSRRPRALVFVPPLVGSTVGHQARDFRGLVRGGLDLMTFSYSGHGDSTGRFSLSASLEDVHGMLLKARRISRREGLSLFGIASCYAAIPFLSAIHRIAEPVQRMVLINAISRLSPLSVVRSFLRYYHEALSTGNGVPGLRTAFVQYADLLFPGVVKNRNGFGVLRRKRARWGKIISEFFTMDPLRNVCLEGTSALCIYARRDPVLDMYATVPRFSYRRDIQRICPETEFRVLDDDHFLSRPAVRGKATRLIASFFHEGLQGNG